MRSNTLIKDISINPYISSITYNYGQENSCSYVTNEKSSNEFLFEGLTSDLWNVILTSKGDKSIIWNFVIKNHLENEYEFFLDELYYSDVITYGNIDEIYNNILTDSKNSLCLNPDKELLDEFLLEKKIYLYKNKFLYSLTFDLFDDNKHPKSLTAEEIIKIIKQAKDNTGVNIITLNVKSEKLNDDFFKIASYIREYYMGLNIKVYGHSLYNTDKVITKLQKLFPRRVIIPLYSVEENVHDSITGIEGSLRDTFNIIEELKNRNIPVNIYYEKGTNNDKDLQDVLKYSYHIGAEFSFEPVCQNDNFRPLNLFNDDYIKTVSSIEDQTIVNYCQKLFICYNGDVYSDSKHLHLISNVRQESISNIWMSLVKK